jgi:hypothetical protein
MINSYHSAQTFRQCEDDLYKDKGIRTFFDIYASLVVSEASSERMFSFFKRTYASLLRKSLKLKTLAHLGTIYVNLIQPYKFNLNVCE